ncbi:RloB family protein [Sphingobacterium daejeonense]|uniref:RloB family protein n=1 Tax=Sphingobacterium daejeonense TaxID=371142 RepID=UPI0010C390F7|nr:RloB family protein [Sphingobacterium daejeonense]VTP93182.1 Uncharacterised protein [Sphingobacterium daejeonense]
MKIKPWEIKETDSRPLNNLINVLIFTEDEVSEKYYFEWFQNNDLKVTVFPNQKSGIKNIINIISHCEKEEIIYKSSRNGSYKIKDGFEIWSVFDKDSYRESPNRDSDISYNIAIDYAIKSGFNVAWSNDCFELWILLHFFDEENVLDLMHRDQIYDELSKIFFEYRENKEIPLESFRYNEYFKKQVRFINIVRFNILPNTELAINRAERLFSKFEEKKSFSEINPCTTVFELVKKLLSLGQKELP